MFFDVGSLLSTHYTKWRHQSSMHTRSYYQHQRIKIHKQYVLSRKGTDSGLCSLSHSSYYLIYVRYFVHFQHQRIQIHKKMSYRKSEQTLVCWLSRISCFDVGSLLLLHSQRRQSSMYIRSYHQHQQITIHKSHELSRKGYNYLGSFSDSYIGSILFIVPLRRFIAFIYIHRYVRGKWMKSEQILLSGFIFRFWSRFIFIHLPLRLYSFGLHLVFHSKSVTKLFYDVEHRSKNTNKPVVPILQ
jgi:hypothetical protein